MSYGPVNVPGASGGLSDTDLESVTSAVEAAKGAASAAQKAAADAKTTAENLEKAIRDGSITVKTQFPVVAADPENPKQGEAWILKGQS